MFVMPQIADVMGPWHEYYTLLGTASATMVALLFVAASLATGVFSGDRRAPLRVFLSASVVNFSLVLAVCLILLAPIRGWTSLGMMVFGCGTFGLTYCGLSWRDMLRDGLFANIDLEDRIWYIAMPFVGALAAAGSGVLLVLQLELGANAMAVSTGLLLAIGIHNAWDITVWSMTRRRR